jgi:hypothetical protein
MFHPPYGDARLVTIKRHGRCWREQFYFEDEMADF